MIFLVAEQNVPQKALVCYATLLDEIIPADETYFSKIMPFLESSLSGIFQKAPGPLLYPSFFYRKQKETIQWKYSVGPKCINCYDIIIFYCHIFIVILSL